MPRVKRLLDAGEISLTSRFITCDPLPFFEFVALEKSAKLILTDSGTCQEEAALFGVPCLVMRRETERPETFETGCVSFISPFPAEDNVLGGVLENAGRTMSLGDGHTSERILNDLVDKLERDDLFMNPFIFSYVGWHYS
jgi:UDP-N-acetylglucosamine 2-epimerase